MRFCGHPPPALCLPREEHPTEQDDARDHLIAEEQEKDYYNHISDDERCIGCRVQETNVLCDNWSILIWAVLLFGGAELPSFMKAL